MVPRGLVLMSVLVAACSGSGSSPAGPGLATLAPGGSAGTGTSAPGIESASAPAATYGVGGNTRPFKASGARVRIMNMYKNAPGDPAALDIYGGFNAAVGPRLVNVPFGTLTDWFDPGLIDDQGDAELSFYPAGKAGNDDQIGSQSETLKGTEVITILIGTSDSGNLNPARKLYAQWKVIFETATEFPLPTAPTVGDAVLMADAVGLSSIPGTSDTFMFLGVDGTCLPSVDRGTDGGGQPTGPHSQQNYVVPPGSHDVTFHTIGPTGAPDCKAASTLDKAHYNLKAGERAFLALFSPDDKTLKTLLIPVGP